MEEEGRDRGAKSNYAAASKPDPHGEEEEQIGPEKVPPKTWPHGFLEEERVRGFPCFSLLFLCLSLESVGFSEECAIRPPGHFFPGGRMPTSL